MRRYAFKLSYIGTNYTGIAISDEDDNSVESFIFKALKKTMLVADTEHCNYSRAGRTDKGVSALGNVFSLDIRTNIIKEGWA